VNLQEVAGGKKFLELLLEAANFTGYRLIRRTLRVWEKRFLLLSFLSQWKTTLNLETVFAQLGSWIIHLLLDIAVWFCHTFWGKPSMQSRCWILWVIIMDWKTAFDFNLLYFCTDIVASLFVRWIIKLMKYLKDKLHFCLALQAMWSLKASCLMVWVIIVDCMSAFDQLLFIQNEIVAALFGRWIIKFIHFLKE